MSQNFVDQKILYGSRAQRFIRELVTNSGLFWLFDMARKVGSDGAISYLTYPAQWVLLGAALAQSWIMSREPGSARWWHHFIAPAVYTVIDVLIEGPAEFFSAPYHLFYWGWAAAMAVAYLGMDFQPDAATLTRSVLQVSLLPASYLFAELEQGIVVRSTADLFTYWVADPAHFFILFGTVLLGIALGLTALLRDRFEAMLYRLAAYFEQLASWSFDRTLMQAAYEGEGTLDLQRVDRSILFIDIRGFTSWSELHSPGEVVDLVNRFYSTAEPIVKAHHGFKIQMTGDEIMTRFYTPDDALNAALDLQHALGAELKTYGLSAGIGIHTGEVIEGLVGGDETRQYGIFGDHVNVAARLQSEAGPNQIIASRDLWLRIADPPASLSVTEITLTLKGKEEAFPACLLVY